MSIFTPTLQPTLSLDPSLTVQVKPTIFCCFTPKIEDKSDSPVWINSKNTAELFDSTRSNKLTEDYTKTLSRIEEHLKSLAEHTGRNSEEVIREARSVNVIPTDAKTPITVKDVRSVNEFARKWIRNSTSII